MISTVILILVFSLAHPSIIHLRCPNRQIWAMSITLTMSPKLLVQLQLAETIIQPLFMVTRFISMEVTTAILGSMIYTCSTHPVLFGVNQKSVDKSHRRVLATQCLALAENFTCSVDTMVKSASTKLTYSIWIPWLGSHHRFKELSQWRGMLTQWPF